MPKSRRASAPKQSRSTISTPESEFGTESECDPQTVIIECADEGGGATGGWQSGFVAGPECTETAYQDVTSATDVDQDGIKDVCESRIAIGLQPNLVRNNAEQYFGREPYWTVKRVAGTVTIMYLLSYYHDGPPWEHVGDSEFIIMTVRPLSGGTWKVQNITTSAHWGVCCGGDYTATYNAGGFIFSGAAAYVFVSQDHHGNYKSKSNCDSRFFDGCSHVGTDNVELVGVTENGNIGSSQFPFDLDSSVPNTSEVTPDCTRSRVDQVSYPGVECFFTDYYYGSAFRGWTNQSGGATHYNVILQAYGLY